MKKSLKLTVVAAAIATALPFHTNAAGLGGINVFSALGQPLRAEIELHATPQELDGMSARVPSPEAFSRANLEYSPLMTDLEMNIERRGSRSVIRLSSSRVVNEPFMNVLVELRWAAGSLLREYTFLLDPVDMRPTPAPVAAAPSRSAASPAPARVATRPAAAVAPAGGRHVVRRGETLHRIAVDRLPPGAELEQMLLALLRENPEAFAGGNINRLQAGASLRIPDQASITAIPADQARREVLAQAAEFEAYRNRVASNVAGRAPTPERAATRESAGRVEPRAEEIVRTDAPADQVQVSGALPSPGEGTAVVAAPVASAAEGARTATLPEEDVVALMREMEEMRARLAELEQTVADRQGISELRDSMTRGQGDAAPASDAPAVVSPPPAVEPAAQPQPAAEPVAKPRPAPVPAAPPQPSMLDSLMANPLMLALAAALIGLLALLGIRIARRRREEAAMAVFVPEPEEPNEPLSVVSQPGGESVDTDSSTSVMDTDFSQTGLSAIDADEGVDPVAEADVYLAYGRDAQAEEILLDALKVDASRHAIYLKLLEVYVQRNDRRQFEVIATDLYSRTGGEGSDWNKAASMGRKLDPENPLYGPGGKGGALMAGVVAAGAAAVAAGQSNQQLEATHVGLDESELELPDLGPEISEAAEPAAEAEDAAEVELAALDFDLGEPPAAALDEPVDMPPAAETEADETPVADDENVLSFDLDLGSDVPASGAVVEPAAEPPRDQTQSSLDEPPLEEETVMDLERTEFDANLLDFDLDLSPPAPEKSDTPEGLDLTSIDLDLDLPGGMDQVSAPELPAAEAPPAEVDGEPAVVPQFDAEDVQREMDTKLELARAYDEMGDCEGARELLDEVVKDGSAEQKQEAQRMLDRLA